MFHVEQLKLKVMIINIETGEIVTKSDKLNTRHRWVKLSNHHWQCIKCYLHKESIGKNQYNYWDSDTVYNYANKCNNNQVKSTKNENKNSRNIKTRQVRLFD